MNNFNHSSNFKFYYPFLKDSYFYLQSFNTPSLTLNNINTSSRQNNLNFQGDTLKYGDLSLNFIVDENLLVYKELINGIKYLKDPLNNNGNLNPNLEAKLFITNDNSTKNILEVTFFNILITEIGELTLDTKSEDDILTVNARFVFDEFDIN